MTDGWSLWRKGKKDEAASAWEKTIKSDSDDLAQAGAHAGLGIYYAEEKEKKKSLYHANLALEMTPRNATISYAMNMNALGISLAKNKDYAHAESILKKVANINELNEKSNDFNLSRQSKHERGKNGYNLASLVYMPQKRFDEAIKELKEEVLPRYKAVQTYPTSTYRIKSDLAAAHHRISESYIGISDTANIKARPQILELAKDYENRSFDLWKSTSDFPDRVKTAENNVKNLEDQITKTTTAVNKMRRESFPRNG